VDIYLIRHTRPDLGPGICYGQLDVALAPDCEGDIAAVSARLGAAAGAPVVTPSTQRCRRLADALAAVRASRVVVEERLRELDFGEWEGLPWDEIPRVQTDVWTRDIWNQAAPGGESYAALHERVAAAWETLEARADPVLLVVAPAGPLRTLLTVALDLPPDAFMRMHLDYGGIAKLCDSTGGWRLDFSNR